MIKETSSILVLGNHGDTANRNTTTLEEEGEAGPVSDNPSLIATDARL